MKHTYLVQHLIENANTRETIRTIGIYSDRELALEAINKLSSKSGFRRHPRLVDPEKDAPPSGFYIDKYEVDRDHWEDGFEETE